MAHIIRDQDRYIRLNEITVDFIKRRPTSDLQLVFEDHVGAKHKSNKFKQGDLVQWNLDMYVTSGTLTIRRLGALFNSTVAEISVNFKPNEGSDCRAIKLEDSNHRVTANFLCGRSQSLADVTPVLDSQRSTTTVASKVPRCMRLPQLAVLPPPASERGHDVAYATIRRLNDDILLVIFNCYRLDEGNHWNIRLGWCRLTHVCQRWRHLIYEDAFLLDMHIQCTNCTAMVDALDHLPPLPLFVDYRRTAGALRTAQSESAIYHALRNVLRLRDRVRQIILRLPHGTLYRCLELIDGRFPILEHLSLWSAADKIPILTLPKGFIAPNLRHLALPGIGLPARLRPLTSTISLVTLDLRNIKPSGYFRPRVLVARLRSLPQLEELHIGFSILRPRTERELLGEQESPATLLNLKHLSFAGVSTYLESLAAQIRTPLLEQLGIMLYDRIAAVLPHLSHLINITEGFKHPTLEARVTFDRSQWVFISTTTHRSSRGSDRPFCVSLTYNSLDHQRVDCTVRICAALSPTLSGVEQLTLDFPNKAMYEWETDGTRWHELFRLFIGVRELHIHDVALVDELSRALQADEVASDPGFLPNLQHIVATDNRFGSFIDARRVVGHSILFSPLRRAPPLVF